MAIFRKAPQLTSPVEGLEAAQLIAMADTTVSDGMGVLASERRVDVVPPFEIYDKKLDSLATEYSIAWRSVSSIIENTDLTESIEQLGGLKTLEYNDGSFRSAKRKLGREEQNALSLAAVSARLRGAGIAGALDGSRQSIEPFLYQFASYAYEGSPEDCAYFTVLQDTAMKLEPHYVTAENAVVGSARLVASYIENGGIDEFVMWLREASVNGRHEVLRVIAQDVHDPNGNNFIRDAVNRGLNVESKRLIDKFAEVLCFQDGEFETTKTIFDFLVQAMKLQGIEGATLSQIIIDTAGIWPDNVKREFSQFAQSQTKDLLEEISRLTQGHFLLNRRRPKQEDLRILEADLLASPESEKGRSNGKVVRAGAKRVSSDFTAVVSDQPTTKERIKRSELTRAKTEVSSGKRFIKFDEVGSSEEVEKDLVEEYIKRYRLVGPEQDLARRDIRKMLSALCLNPTRNNGVTLLSEVNPYTDVSTKKQHKIWRLNPVFYSGLSVSRGGKDTRILFVVENGTVAVLDILRHDDYEHAIKGLR